MNKSKSELENYRDSKPQVKLNTRLLPVVVVLLIVLQLVVPYQGWMMLLVGLGGMWLVALLWAHSLARGLHLVREMRFGWAQVGDRLEERFTLINNGYLPALWVEVQDQSTLPNYEVSRATGVYSASENQWSVKGVCNRRGAYTLGPTTLRTGDPFGIYSITLTNPACTNMMVMPPIVPLPQIEVAPGGRAGEGRRRTHSFERTVNAAGVREYTPGDSLSLVHWRVSAHRDDLHVRLFDSTPASDWWICLDLNQTVQAGSGENSTIEHGVILAASLADRGLRMGRSVGLVMHGQNLVWLPPLGGEARRWEILRELALVSAGTRSLDELLTQMRPSFKRQTSLVIITPDVQGDWVASLLSLRRRGIVPTILLLDCASFGGIGDVGRVVNALADAEVARYMISRDVLDRPESHPGQEGVWDWHASPFGRAVAKHQPRDTAWRALP